MKNALKFIVILTTVLFVGCSSDDSTTENDDAVFNSLQANPAPEPRNCESTSPLVGQSSELRFSAIYGISGTVTIVSDCEIEISDFFYNGQGPNISVYAGIDGDFEGGVNMSEPIQGRVFQGETLNLFLPEGASFNDFNSISIWCFEFDVDFSSAFFE
ncbi:hypothetical protein GTQ40_06885 [Flavobacteriaceae bacterium R38]|nr:hypothetical protein [Flavobacteriaceae bacterium R38]